MDLAEGINQISVSGVQEKLSAVEQNGQIVLTPQGERGRYIIKPAPSYKNFRFRNFIPANEHLTMQIAKQVFKMKVAENGIVFFANDEAVYITKRFDFDADGNKIKQEDFSSLAQKTTNTRGKDYKYTVSYEDVAALKQFPHSRPQGGPSKITNLRFNLVILPINMCLAYNDRG